MEMNEQDRKKLERLAAEWRYVVADMICRRGAGISAEPCRWWKFSSRCTTGFFASIRVIPNGRPGSAGGLERPRRPIVYTALAYKGYFPREDLLRLNVDGTNLPSHCDMLRTPGIDMTAGSLGQGLSAAAGMALGAKKDHKKFHVFCIVGDGDRTKGRYGRQRCSPPITS
jgi:hypothetical protein